MATMTIGPAAYAQQITGTPGSPSATTTIDGSQLPAPPQKFDGTLGLWRWLPSRPPAIRGYPTWFGKNHNTPAFQASQVGPFDQWPTGMGFEYFYGFIGGDTNQWQPNLFRNTTQIYPFEGKPGWNLITAMADDAIDWMNRINEIAPDKPFFLYYVPGGTHAPHHPTPEWIEKISDMHLFDEGWNKLREQIFANQKRLGVIPQDAKLTPWPEDLSEGVGHAHRRREEAVHPPGRGLRRLRGLHRPRDRPRDPGGRGHGQARQHADHLHRRRQRHQRRGHADRHAERGGGLQRRPSAGRGQLKYFYDVWGTDQTYNHMAVRLVVGVRHAVQVDQADRLALRRHPPGHGDLLAGRIKDKGGIRNQFHHVIDIVPTILEATGIRAPRGRRRHPAEARSRASAWPTPSTRPTPTRRRRTRRSTSR